MIMVPALKDWIAQLEKEDRHTQKFPVMIKEMDQR